MVSVIILTATIGFYCHFLTSERITITFTGVASWLQQRKPIAKTLGSIGLVAALTLAIYYYGIGAGSFVFVILLSAIACLVILLAPLRIVRLWQLVVVGSLMIVLEKLI